LNTRLHKFNLRKTMFSIPLAYDKHFNKKKQFTLAYGLSIGAIT